MPKITLHDLAAALASSDRYTRFQTVEAYGKQKPSVDALPLLRKALHDSDFATVRAAANSLRKLGLAARAATEDLLTAAQTLHSAGLPQAYPQANVALAYVNPDEPRILEVIEKNFTHDNWVPVKASVEALQRISSREAKGLCRRVISHWLPHTNKTQRKYFESVLATLAGKE